MKKIVISSFLAGLVLYVIVVHKSPVPLEQRSIGRRQLQEYGVDSVCKSTLYPNECLLTLQGVQSSTIKADMAVVSLEASFHELQKLSTMAVAMEMSSQKDDVIEDCGTLFQSSLRHVNGSLKLVKKVAGDELKGEHADDVKTWLSASLTDLEACKPPLPQQLHTRVAKLLSISLAIVNSINHRRLLSEPLFPVNDGFPSWVSPADRRLLQSSPAANAVVAKDGSGNYRTVTEAVEAAPSKSGGRYVIHVKAGVYTERVFVTKDNIMLVGDGKDVTVVSGSKSGESLKSIPTFGTLSIGPSTLTSHYIR